MIKLTEIEQLYHQLEALPIKHLPETNIVDVRHYKIQFNFSYNDVEADALLFLERNPYILAIATKETSYYFEFELAKNFEVSSRMEGENYFNFIKAFKIGNSTAFEPFKPSFFGKVSKPRSRITLERHNLFPTPLLLKEGLLALKIGIG